MSANSCRLAPARSVPAVFARDGDTARDVANRVHIAMVGINAPVPGPPG